VILDKGICTVFRAADAASAGDIPALEYTPLHRSWYGELSFETSPASPTEDRIDLQTDARIRVHQCRDIRQRDVVILRSLASWALRAPADRVYTVERAYHGYDDDGPTAITDLTLREVSP